MEDLRVRPMTGAEFAAFRSRLVRSYAADQVQAGNLAAGDAEDVAASQTDRLLPDGVDTPGMLLLTAETPAAEPVGSVWVALRRSDGGEGAWIFDIEVLAGHRGKGYGRALLAAAERETARHGVTVIGLNVFGANAVARGLYESSGYETIALQMRKDLTGR